jgi:hypothetical protein
MFFEFYICLVLTLYYMYDILRKKGGGFFPVYFAFILLLLKFTVNANFPEPFSLTVRSWMISKHEVNERLKKSKIMVVILMFLLNICPWTSLNCPSAVPQYSLIVPQLSSPLIVPSCPWLILVDPS